MKYQVCKAGKFAAVNYNTNRLSKAHRSMSLSRDWVAAEFFALLMDSIFTVLAKTSAPGTRTQFIFLMGIK